jgi:hypothetical protein
MTRREVLSYVEIPDVDIQEFNAWQDFKRTFVRDEYIFLKKEEEKQEELVIQGTSLLFIFQFYRTL